LKIAVVIAAFVLPSLAAAQDHMVNGYVKQDGTYVAPHMQTNPNATRADNYSTIGNVNPYTGVAGTKPLVPPSPSIYDAPKAPNPYEFNAPRKP
jgi:hypothetical protein